MSFRNAKLNQKQVPTDQEWLEDPSLRLPGQAGSPLTAPRHLMCQVINQWAPLHAPH